MTDLHGDASAARSLADGLGRAAAAVGDLQAPNTAAGDLILAASKPPVRSGELAGGMYADASAQDVVVASRAPHFTYVHWGAPRINVRANPFILAALQGTRSRIIDTYTTHARDALSRNL